MELEQRVQSLEQEVQLLKAQIQATLLDIQAHLLTNAYPSLRSEAHSSADSKSGSLAGVNSMIEIGPIGGPGGRDAINGAPVRRISLDTFEDAEQVDSLGAPAQNALPSGAPTPVDSRLLLKRAALIPDAEEDDAQEAEWSEPVPARRQDKRSPSAAAAPAKRSRQAEPEAPTRSSRRSDSSDSKRSPRLSPKTREASRRQRLGEPEKALPFEDVRASAGAAAPNLPLQGTPMPAGEMTSADIEPLKQWLMGKISKHGLDRTRALLDMYVRKDYLKPEVIAVLLRLVDEYEEASRPQVILANSRPRATENGAPRLTAPTLIRDDDRHPHNPEAERKLSSRKLVLRLIAGVQNAGMNWVTRENDDRSL